MKNHRGKTSEEEIKVDVELVSEPVEMPREEIQSTIAFIVNNPKCKDSDFF